MIRIVLFCLFVRIFLVAYFDIFFEIKLWILLDTKDLNSNYMYLWNQYISHLDFVSLFLYTWKIHRGHLEIG